MWWGILLVSLTLPLALFQTSFLSGFSDIWRPDFILLGTVTLIAGFRFRLALVFALVGGFLIDATSRTGWGPAIFAELLATLSCQWAFRRIITNSTWPAFLSLNLIGFIVMRSTLSIGQAIINQLLLGSSGFGVSPDIATFWSLTGQLTISAGWLYLLNRLKREFSDRFLLSRHATG